MYDKFNMAILGNWHPSASSLGTNSAVRFFAQPLDYEIEDIHLDLNEYRFVERRSDGGKIPLKSHEYALMDELCQLYEQLRERTIKRRRQARRSKR